MDNLPIELLPKEGLDREQVALLLLASIAFKQFSLAHVMNASAEELQAALGLIENPEVGQAESLDELLEANNRLEQSLQHVIKKEILLLYKLDNILKYLKENP
ncbi:hypothetical protein BpOF4_08735 [Alkalihalophilus pseudofirmus OF4]|uniref:Uncharacterized protein n=1 Tax=Alkalihalophilus pseudofirmus (strain ATCC BAA-2126 / JCM 17055 / OF4) TaxID=398511 RepID=D3FRP5_ALKPO|nr:hypothetical protein [Alkalihalophilus pseudofirmus]ADC49805.1 hypothetical protein BpOF4_08735 [Alkalihalophilus pseudofirmus OF4]